MYLGFRRLKRLESFRSKIEMRMYLGGVGEVFYFDKAPKYLKGI